MTVSATSSGSFGAVQSYSNGPQLMEVDSGAVSSSSISTSVSTASFLLNSTSSIAAASSVAAVQQQQFKALDERSLRSEFIYRLHRAADEFLSENIKVLKALKIAYQKEATNPFVTVNEGITTRFLLRAYLYEIISRILRDKKREAMCIAYYEYEDFACNHTMFPFLLTNQETNIFGYTGAALIQYGAPTCAAQSEYAKKMGEAVDETETIACVKAIRNEFQKIITDPKRYQDELGTIIFSFSQVSTKDMEWLINTLSKINDILSTSVDDLFYTNLNEQYDHIFYLAVQHYIENLISSRATGGGENNSIAATILQIVDELGCFQSGSSSSSAAVAASSSSSAFAASQDAATAAAVSSTPSSSSLSSSTFSSTAADDRGDISHYLPVRDKLRAQYAATSDEIITAGYAAATAVVAALESCESNAAQKPKLGDISARLWLSIWPISEWRLLATKMVVNKRFRCLGESIDERVSQLFLRIGNFSEIRARKEVLQILRKPTMLLFELLSFQIFNNKNEAIECIEVIKSEFQKIAANPKYYQAELEIAISALSQFPSQFKRLMRMAIYRIKRWEISDDDLPYFGLALRSYIKSLRVAGGGGSNSIAAIILQIADELGICIQSGSSSSAATQAATVAADDVFGDIGEWIRKPVFRATVAASSSSSAVTLSSISCAYRRRAYHNATAANGSSLANLASQGTTVSKAAASTRITANIKKM